MLNHLRGGLLRVSAGLVIGVSWLGIAADANAVPSMARQTGYQCSKCHAGYPELTNFGRQFKLTGYTMSSEKWDEGTPLSRIPISAALQISRTSSSDVLAGGTNGDGSTASDFPNDGKTLVTEMEVWRELQNSQNRRPEKRHAYSPACGGSPANEASPKLAGIRYAAKVMPAKTSLRNVETFTAREGVRIFV